MNPADITHVASESLYLVLFVSAPVLGASLLVGLGVALAQAVTQVQDFTLSFVPKLIAVGVTLVVGGGWMAGQLVRFTDHLWRAIPHLVH